MLRNKEKNYRFNSLNVINWDSTSKGERRYRTVFDRWELRYSGAELSFFNKKFDEQDWEAVVCLRAFSMKKGEKSEELCRQEETLTITSDQNEVKIAKGWGNEEAGKFWVKGDFIWEASINDEMVGSARFTVQDIGLVKKKANPYFDTLSLKVYEAPGEDLEISKRKYFRRFDTRKTRYIFGEFRLINHVQNEWLCELFFNFVDDTGQLIGRVPSCTMVQRDSPGDDIFTVTHGWGNESTDNWKQDDYTLQVEFQEVIVAVVPFTVGTENKEDIISTIKVRDIPDPSAYFGDAEKNGLHEDLYSDEDDDEINRKVELDSALLELEDLIGLRSIKEQIREHISYLDFLQVRKKMGFKEDQELSLHSVFTGNPGTGKTTVVKLLGQIYHAMGLLSQGHVHTVDSADLIAGFVRQTQKQTEDEIAKARGGILFIDEAYMLYRKGLENDFGAEAIAALVSEMSDGPGDIAIMLAGYPAEVREMVESNPGLKSRVKHFFNFDDYSPEELMAIADYAAGKKNVELAPDARKELQTELTRAYRKRDRTFGNARFVNTIIDEAKINLGVRVMKNMKGVEMSKQMVSTILKEDIKEIFTDKLANYIDIATDEELLAYTLRELDGLIGLENIKQEVRNLVKLVKYYREIRKNVRRSFPLHSVFTGNPGTGKTTLARIMGNLYKALGILERGHLVECDSSDLIAGFLGQTALKTKEKINEAMGGVLFIDEAYSLTDGQHPDFGRKAIETIIKQMEDRRGEFAVIVAGYPRPMKAFIESNPGLESRFDQTYIFQDFTEGELYIIAQSMFRDAELTLTPEADERLNSYLTFLYRNRNQFFGNARSVRKIVDRTVLNQNLRMASLEAAERTEEMTHLITVEDLKDFGADSVAATSRSVGFKF
jgi:SpoVK/Ycf46/Vps4 family AAA+-type ATPase